MDRAAIESLLMPATYGRHLARMFAPDRLLANTGLTALELADPDRRITVRQAIQYIDNVRQMATEPDWYLSWAGTLSDHFHGPLSVALMSAPTLGDGLDAFLRFFPGRIPYMHMQGRLDGGHYYAEMCPLIDLGACTPMLVETPLLIVQHYLDNVYGVDLTQARVELDYPAPSYADRYARHLKCPVVFEAVHNAIVIPAAWREQRNLGYMESTWAHALLQCEATMGSSRERTTLGQVRKYLCDSYQVANRRRALPTLEEVAEHLHLAPRTLIRRLRHLGTTYQAIMDDFLRGRATELLANDTIKIKEVADALGFSNPANFGKAFKRWFGVSPGGFRAGQARGTPTPRASR